jgi:hypothetical protein
MPAKDPPHLLRDLHPERRGDTVDLSIVEARLHAIAHRRAQLAPTAFELSKDLVVEHSRHVNHPVICPSLQIPKLGISRIEIAPALALRAGAL